MSLEIGEAWKGKATSEFARCIQEGAGFSFRYDGSTAGPKFDQQWRQITANDSSSAVTSISIEHENGLIVTREMRTWPNFPAVEYKLRFKNGSRRTLAPLSDIHALDLSFAGRVFQGNCVVSCGGGLFDPTLPPKSYALRTRRFASILDEYTDNIFGEEYLTTEGGHSSNKDFPFFFIQNDASKAGIYVAMGWSGQWWARAFLQPKTRTLNIAGKIPGLEIALEPGEEVVGPAVLIGLYAGSLCDGSNQLRRLISEHYTPRLAGKKFLPVATYDTFFGGIGVNFDEGLLRKLADAAGAIDQDYFLLDLGWFGNVTEASGAVSRNHGRGSWYDINRARLPNGLLPVAEYVRSKGMGMGLWFEPETVDPDSYLAREKPEWVLWNYTINSSAQRDLLSRMNGDRGLLDFGRTEVQDYVCDVLDHYIREYDLRYIRYDLNIQPLPYWDHNDRPGRRGLMQLRHIQGLYAMLDRVRERHPHVILEGCAGGGRRIDLEMARRFHVFWVSDYTCDPAVSRFHLFGFHHFLPGNYPYILYALPTVHQNEFEPDDLGFQSLFAGSFGTSGRVDLWPDRMREMARKHIAVYKRLRRYLIEDYYALSEQPADLKSWSGWQFNDPKSRSGFVQTFRTGTAEGAHRFFLKGLDDTMRYLFVDAYSEHRFEAVGRDAVLNGIEIAQPPMSSRIFLYKEAGSVG